MGAKIESFAGRSDPAMARIKATDATGHWPDCNLRIADPGV